MIEKKSIKKIWFLCLCCVSLTLTWCFHVPNKDRLPNQNKFQNWIKSKSNHKDLNQVLDSLINDINTVSNTKKDNNADSNE